MRIEVAYTHKNDKGSTSFNTVLVDQDGNTFTDTQWIISGNAKGNKPYYEKNGKKFPLPGYSHADALVQLVTSKSLLDLQKKEVTLKLYDSKLKKEAPTNVESYPELVGASLQVGFHQIRENKNVLQGNKYVPTNEERVYNEVNKYFDGETGKTRTELTGNSEAVFLGKWEAKFSGQLQDKYKTIPNAATSAVQGGSPFAAGANQGTNAEKASSSLFGDTPE
jgi:hypothetical protein